MEISQDELSQINEEEDWVVDSVNSEAQDQQEQPSIGTLQRKKPAPGGLSAEKTKTLLEAFELSGETRESFDLWALCSANPTTLGAEGTVLRRQVQQRWAKCKGRSIRAYIAYLKKIGVTPGPKSLEEMNKKPAYPDKPAFSDNASTAPSTSDEEIIVPDEEEEDPYAMVGIGNPFANDNVDQLEADFGQVSLADDRKPAARASVPSLPAAQNQEAVRMFHTPPRPVAHAGGFNPGQQQHRFRRLSPLVAQAARTNVAHAFVPTAWFVNQNGTVKNPWVIPICLDKMAERHREFDVQFVENINQDGFFTRSGFHIRRPVACPDMNDWEADIPTDDYDEMWRGRLIRFRGPAQDFWIRDTERYHAGIGRESKIKCDATFNAHSATEVAIEESKEHWRASAYWIMVFPPGVQLENKIFSLDDNIVPVTKNPLKLKKDHPENLFNKEILAMTLFWRIALKGGKKIGGKQSEKKKEAEAKSMFED